MSELKIISWNANGIRTRIKNKDINPILEKEGDILLFQETKTSYEQMDKKFLDKSQYEYYFLKGESPRTGGLATFSKEKPNIVKRFFNESSDALGRASVLDYDNFTLIHIYAPAGTGTKAKLAEKLNYFKNLLSFAQKNNDKDLIIAGDFNAQFDYDAYSESLSYGYVDSRATATVSTENHGAFNDWTQTDESKFAYGDHILTSQNCTTLTYEVMNDEPSNMILGTDGVTKYYESDHFPIRATIDVGTDYIRSTTTQINNVKYNEVYGYK